MQVNVAIAEDQSLFRKGLKQLMDEYLQNIKIVMEAENGADLLNKLALCEEDLPHILLLDISMPLMDGIETFGHLRKKYPGMKVIVLSVHQEDRYVVKMIELGANGYLLKNAELAEVEKAILQVMEHDYYFNERMIASIKKGLRNRKDIELNSAKITSREKEILQLICEEKTAAEIATGLFISERTVEGHRNNLLQKTGAKNTAGLVIYAIKNQLVSI
jgi:DNA-binding NarL/FixJ family response regulator